MDQQRPSPRTEEEPNRSRVEVSMRMRASRPISWKQASTRSLRTTNSTGQRSRRRPEVSSNRLECQGETKVGFQCSPVAVALAKQAIERGYGAYFVRSYELMEDLRRARVEHNLDCRMMVYLAPKVLIVDEFGIWPYDRESATAFFTLVSARYERGSIILTSNKGFGE